MPGALFCASCRMLRPAAELLAFWRTSDPDRVRFVCRPSLQRPEVPPCFREMVADATVHRIALADRALGVAA